MLKACNSQKILAFCALSLAVLIYSIYTPALKNGFVNWDDDVHLLENPFVHHFNKKAISDIFTTLTCKTYIPLTELSFAIEYHFFQDQPFIYHWTNIVLHILVSIMVMFLAVRLGIQLPGAFLAGLIFGVHPMHVESVAWVTERKDVLYSFFYMAAILGYCEYLKRYKENGKFSKRLLYIVFVSGFLAVLAKPMAWSLPFVLCVLDWYFKRPLKMGIVIEKLTLGVLFWPVVSMTSSHHLGLLKWQFPESVILGVWQYTIYLRKFFWPDEFFLFYKTPAVFSFINPEWWICAVILSVLIAVIFVRKLRIAHFAVLYYTASIFLLMPFEHSGYLGCLSDRFMYLASVGFCVSVGAFCEFLCSRAKGISMIFSTAGIIVVIFFLVSKTIAQIQVWRSGITLWEHQRTVKSMMMPVLVYNKLAEAYYGRWIAVDQSFGGIKSDPEDLDKAVSFLKKAIVIRPDYAGTYRNLGVICLESQNYNCATKNLEKAISLNKGDFEGYFQLGRLYLKEGKKEDARNAFNQALVLSPDNPILYERIYYLMPMQRSGQ